MHSIVKIQLGMPTKRTLAWMVYLNDVEEGGETEFLYQELKLKPSKRSSSYLARIIYSPP